MKRMGRWLFNRAAAVSLLLCIAAAAAMGYTYIYFLGWNGPVFGRQLTVAASHGRVSFDWISLETTPPANPTPRILGDPPSQLISLKLSGLPASARVQSPANSLLGLGYENQPVARRVSTINTAPRQGYSIVQVVPTTAPVPGGLFRRGVVVPLWMLAALSACVPLLWLRDRHASRFARVEGLCPACGYDLCATPERCPECGAVPEVAKGSTI